MSNTEHLNASKNWIFEAARQQIRIDTLLKKSKHGNYCCIYCGSGTGNNGKYDGAVKIYDDNTCYCHACKRYADPVDIIAAQQNMTLSEAADYAKEHYHLTKEMAAAPIKITGKKKIPVADYTAYYQKCADMLDTPEALDYLRKRGISKETAKRFGIGFDPEADPANAPGFSGNKKHPCPRIIIPVTTGHYIGRSIKPETPDGLKKLNNRDGDIGIFNADALTNDTGVCFVFEGAFNALSTLEIGFPAVAINSTSNVDKLLKAIKDKPNISTLIISMDNDSAGKTASDALVKAFTDSGIKFSLANITGGKNDANDALVANKEEFIKAVQSAADQAHTAPMVIHEAAVQPTNEVTLPENTELTAAEIAKKLLKPLSEVKPEGKRYIYKPYLPIGKPSLLYADPGTGKTKAASALAALITTGEPLCGIPCERKGKVLLFSVEDDAEDFLHTIKACGGNTEMITVINTDDHEALALLAQNKLTFDSPIVEEMIKIVQPVMVIFDPMQRYLGSKIDMNRANETSAALASVVRLAKQYDCHIMIIGHLTKSQVSMAYRIMGSTDIIGEARSVMTVVRDPERITEQENIIIHTKTNNKRGKAIRYKIESIPGNEDYARIAWLGLEDYDERDYNQAQKKKQGEAKTGVNPESIDNPVVKTILTLLKDNEKYYPDGIALLHDDFQAAKKIITGSLIDIRIETEIRKIDAWLENVYGVGVCVKSAGRQMKPYYLKGKLYSPSRSTGRYVFICRSRLVGQEQGKMNL